MVGSVTEGLVGELADNGVSYDAFSTAGPAPPTGFKYTAFDERPIRAEVLANGFETELIEPAERRQIRGMKGSVEHVEVFQMVRVGTSIIGRPRPLSGTDAPTPVTPGPHSRLQRAQFVSNRLFSIRQKNAFDEQQECHDG